MNKYISVIGLEVHVQVNTLTKMFCSCECSFGEKPNTKTCPICMGYPGVLPAINENAIKYAVLTGLAFNCDIASYSKTDRKNYFYPDLTKSYQISQYDLPICSNGHVEIELNETEKKKIGITRIHIEEDAGKLIHGEDGNISLLDLNRCGIPLLEIVSEPDMRSSQEAYLYLNTLKSILKYLGVSNCNMEEGSLRCDVNISVMLENATKFGTKIEIKNLNSFRNVQKAIDYEIERQIEAYENGETLVQETRLFDVNKEQTILMRVKEDAQDYRYFPEPDLVPIIIDNKYLNDVKSQLIELPNEKKLRFKTQYELNHYDATVLSDDKHIADYFEEAVKSYPKQPKKIANWMQSEIMRVLNEKQIDIAKFNIPPENIAKIVSLIDDNTISGKIAKQVFDEMINSSENPIQVIERLGLKQVSDESAILEAINKVINDNPDQVATYKAGKKTVIGFFVGQVMKESKGKANPAIVNKLLSEKLESID